MMKITFHINFHTVWGQKVCIVGSVPQLGSWEPTLAQEMEYTGDGNWMLRLELRDEVPFIEYTYFLRVNDRQFFEEWEKPHRVEFDCRSSAYALYDYWQTRPATPAFYTTAFTKSLFAHSGSEQEPVVRSGKRLIVKIYAPRVEKHQQVAITGNQACLGHWQPAQALALHCNACPEWQIELDADEISWPLEYKFLVREKDTPQPHYWEKNENRVLSLPPQQAGETVVVSGLAFRDDLPPWRCAGSVIPVFSLRSENSFGVGDLGDLHLLVDWVRLTHQRIIQVLPVNDTTMSHTWSDSYPYSAISIYALHPMYISLPMMGGLADPGRAAWYEGIRRELNAKDTVDYEAVNIHKLAYCRAFFEQEGKAWLETPAYDAFFRQNEHWLVPYAAYCYLRDRFHTSDFSQWEGYASYDAGQITRLTAQGTEAWPEIAFTFFLQYVLHTQFKAVSDYARQQGVVLKGDLPIGVNRTSVDAWIEPHYFNMNGQAGAPPDDFSLIGQNWMFPTYNWEVMETDHFRWWKSRFRKLEDYFDCFRIDHILGFFRIWEIPAGYVQGLCGHFNPALPLSPEEIEQYGVPFHRAAYTTPHLHRKYLPELFGDLSDEVEQTWLAQAPDGYLTLKPCCDSQQKIERLFAGKGDPSSLRIREGLYTIANEVLFLLDPYKADSYHPRISASQSYIYKELDVTDRYAFDHLYWDFFYHRHNDFWKARAYERLTPLVASTGMLICGEDLGMIPQSVPEVMHKLQILTLEIERMPKVSHRAFTDLPNLPYLSVCTTSTHDMSPLRSWWKEDPEKTQQYYHQVLHREGMAPVECTADVAAQIVKNHLDAPSMLTILPLQDWLATNDALRRADCEAERINVPANPFNYWCYRMHLTLEELLDADGLNASIRSMIAVADRK